MFKPRPHCQVKYHKIYYVLFCFIKDADLSGMYDSFPFGHFIFLWPFANCLAVWYPLLQKKRKFHRYQNMQGRIQNLAKYLRRSVLQKYLMAFASCCNYSRETLHLRCVAGFWMRLSYGTQKIAPWKIAFYPNPNSNPNSGVGGYDVKFPSNYVCEASFYNHSLILVF